MMILESLTERGANNKKSLCVLIDPDKIESELHLNKVVHLIQAAEVDFIFVGGSLLVSNQLTETIYSIKQITDIPVVLFPGSNLHISGDADAILFLSLISGRNADLLIGQHVSAAPILKQSNLEILSTGYILVGDAGTTVAYMSQSMPIPYSKPDIAACTAMAGEMLGLKLIYLDAGSGAYQEVPPRMIQQTRASIEIPLLVGGGINTPEKAQKAYEAGADTLVIGTAIEKDTNFISSVAQVRNSFNA